MGISYQNLYPWDGGSGSPGGGWIPKDPPYTPPPAGGEIDDETLPWGDITAKNLAGRVVTVLSGNNEYIIGGFLTREIYFKPFKNIAPIGTNVTDVNKLVCIDISGDTFTYQVDKTPNDNAFTIVDKNGDPDPEGDYIWIVDQPWVEQNSTGLAFVELQELV